MSPPEVWGPATWTLFHALIEKINDKSYNNLSKDLFIMIKRICKYLPCPECASDATIFLDKIKITNIKSKTEFKNTFYLFHNYVNAKKRKPLFNYSNMFIYSRYKIIPVINNFIQKYNTKGNMKLLAESFQRELILKEFKSWIQGNITAFITPVIQNNIILNNTSIPHQVVKPSQVKVEQHLIEEQLKVEPPLIEKTQLEIVEQPLIEEQIVINTPLIEKTQLEIEETQLEIDTPLIEKTQLEIEETQLKVEEQIEIDTPLIEETQLKVEEQIEIDTQIEEYINYENIKIIIEEINEL
jgi:hypothetical protein